MSKNNKTTIEEQENKNATPSKNSNLGRLFWGAFMLMAATSIGLSIISAIRSASPNEEIPSESVKQLESEMSSEKLSTSLSDANWAALEKVKITIPEMLDAAYDPAYKAIPIYADFHYSVLGEYAELGTAALGKAGINIEKILFNKLNERLIEVSRNVDESFNNEFVENLKGITNASPSSNSTIGNLTRVAINDMLTRMPLTAPVNAAAAVGTAAAVKAASKAIAQKIGTKIAIKAAAKTGGKWAGAGSGATAGALLCSWTGPGAGLCAAAGGVGAWLIADHGIVKLDEYWNREDFEKDLSLMIDDQKNQHKTSLIKALEKRALEVQSLSDKIVQTHDFTLRELASGGTAEVCKIANRIITEYNDISEKIQERSPDKISGLSKIAEENIDNFSLSLLAREVLENIKSAHLIPVRSISIKGNLPPDYQADRKVTTHLTINGNRYKAERLEGFENKDFSITLSGIENLEVNKENRYELAIEQHLYLFNRYFGGSTENTVRNLISNVSKSSDKITFTIPIRMEEDAEDIDQVQSLAKSGHFIDVSILMERTSLPAIKNTPNCF